VVSRDYQKALAKATQELIHAIQERDRLNLEIVRLQKLTTALAATVEQSQQYEQFQQAIANEISFIDTVHSIVRSAERPLTAIDVKDRLAVYGYDLSVYANPMGFVHTSIKRLVDNGRIAEIRPGVYAPNHFWEALLRA
jgi:hypothetical protein